MPLITETYYLSLTQDNRGILRLRCSQDDTLRTVNLKLYNNGSIFVIPSGVSASISGVKQNGTVFSKPCTISQNRENVVLQLSSDITNVDGIIVAEIVLNDGNGGRLGTSNFIIQVEKNPVSAGVVQDTETPIEYINDFIEKIQTLTARLNNLITPSGDASLAEVIDARISSLDGNTYQYLKARIDADIATLNTNKANASNVYTKSQVDNLLENVEIDVDDELSDESENPVQNKVINRAIGEIKADLGANVSYEEQDKTLPQKAQGRENVDAVGKYVGSVNKGTVLAVDIEGNISVQKINLTDKCNDALFNLLSNINYTHDDGNKRRDALMSNFTDKVIELPSAYQQVLYLEATGTQYIVTNIISQIPFECDVEFYVDGANGAVVGAAEPNVANSRFFLCAVITLPSTGQFLVTNRFGATAWNNTAEITVDETGKYHVHSAIEYAESGVKSYIKFGERYSSMDIASAPTVGYPICFFIQRNSGDIFAGLLFSAKFVKSGVVLFDGVPCVRKSDGKPGLYDTVNGVFYTNSGTGEFLYGPEIH